MVIVAGAGSVEDVGVEHNIELVSVPLLSVSHVNKKETSPHTVHRRETKSRGCHGADQPRGSNKGSKRL